MLRRTLFFLAAFASLSLLATSVWAGMFSPLPSHWTADSPTPSYLRGGQIAAAPFLEAISFFVVVLLATGWAVKALVSTLRTDLPMLPKLGYRQSLSLVLLWGFFSVIVLTMISGARELMTPGAWKKQGWSYTLADSAQSSATPADERRRALEALRQALWQHAATHQGQFPARHWNAIDAKLWAVPGWPSVEFVLVEGQWASDEGRLLLYEPPLNGDEQMVLLTNGLIGHMRADEIRAALAKFKQSPIKQP